MRKQHSKKDIKRFLEQHPQAEGFMDKKSVVIEEDDKITVDGNTYFRKHGEGWIPSLELLREHHVLPVVIVDKGTPPFILKGADLMRPGVISCESFKKGDVIVIVDEQHRYPLATGKALLSSEEVMAKKEGKVVKVIHNLKSG
ncbi:pseudouridine synthase [Candidatus Woesearchaeota archaeon]|nr:pseudouridine synthase [Candidatus Woesearchaeota archaeon]